MKNTIQELTQDLAQQIAALPLAEKVDALNTVRAALHEISPFQAEPVDFVKWVPVAEVEANTYNPNHVATPELDLLYLSIKEDGITMPIVAMPEAERLTHRIVDGFHRSRTIRERKDIFQRTHGYAPLSLIEKNTADRMASTIRHNRARGEHQTELMASIIASLTAEGRSNAEIAKALGMEPEEVLRLKQVKGVAEMLANRHYDRAWTVVLSNKEAAVEPES